jgi:hypothetical protein
MLRTYFAGMLIATLVVGGCASRSRTTSSASPANASERLTSATLTFRTLKDGKDEKSSVTAQLLRNGNELAADVTSTGSEFDDNTTAAPLAMALRGPFDRDDARSGQLRLRLTPDGDDTWTFNVDLVLRFADESQRNYSWPAIRLDEKAPERSLVLSGAQGP